ncbi:MAG: repeat protein [Planctomycetaceae bacterium]|nr:repeat protein [Planctomycetaceae bacterium]
MPDYVADKIKPVWKLPFEGAWPVAVSFADSSSRVIAANQDGVMVQWQLPETPVAAKVKDENGKEIDGFETPLPTRQLIGHANTVTQIVPSANGQILFSASYDRTVFAWDLNATPSSESELVVDRDTRERAAKRVEAKKRPEILDAPGVKLASIAPVNTLTGHKDWINALDLSRSGDRLISGDDSGLVIVWDAKTRQKISSWQCPGVAWIVAAALSPDGQTAVISQYRRKGGDFNNYPAGLRIFKVADGSVLLDVLATLYPKEKNPPYQYQYAYHEFVADGLVALAFSPDGKLLAAGQGGEGGGGKIHFLETETGKVVRSVTGHKYGVTDLLFTADGKYLFSAGRDTRFRITRVEDGGEVAVIGKERGGQFTDWLASIALSPDERRLAAADISGFVQVWDLG